MKSKELAQQVNNDKPLPPLPPIERKVEVTASQIEALHTGLSIAIDQRTTYAQETGEGGAEIGAAEEVVRGLLNQISK